MIWLGECYLPGTVGGGNGGGGGGGVVVGDANMAEDREFECLTVLQGHDGDVKCVGFGPPHSQFGNGWEVLYSASYDDTDRVWAEDDNKWYCVMTLDISVHSLTVMCLGLSPGGIPIYSGSMDSISNSWGGGGGGGTMKTITSGGSVQRTRPPDHGIVSGGSSTLTRDTQ